MKRLITLAICLFAFIGFTKADDDKPIQVKDLPKKAQEFIQQNFSAKDVSLAKEEKDFWDKKYEIVFVNGEKVEFNKNGDWKEIDCKFSEVPAAVIPQAIKDVVNKQYPDAKILKIERDDKKYEVKLNNRMELKFTPDFKLYDIDN